MLPQGILQVTVCIVDVPLSSPPLFHASLFPSRASSALTSSWMGLRSLHAVARLTMPVLFAAQFMLNIGLYFHILSARLCERVVCALASTNKKVSIQHIFLFATQMSDNSTFSATEITGLQSASSLVPSVFSRVVPPISPRHPSNGWLRNGGWIGNPCFYCTIHKAHYDCSCRWRNRTSTFLHNA